MRFYLIVSYTLSMMDKINRGLVLTKQVVVWVPLIFESQSSIADMVQILQPLKIRHSYTSSIQVHVLHRETSPTQTGAGTAFLFLREIICYTVNTELIIKKNVLLYCCLHTLVLRCIFIKIPSGGLMIEIYRFYALNQLQHRIKRTWKHLVENILKLVLYLTS